jgi:transketolase
MALEDIAALRAVHGSIALYPADAIATIALVVQMAHTDGVAYLRTTRGAYPVIYSADEGSRSADAKSTGRLPTIGSRSSVPG